MELLFKNVNIIDGTGAPSYVGDVGVSNGKLVLDPLADEAALTVDGSGKYLTPGFIDTHSHGDTVLCTPDYGHLCKINQGVTTQLAAQCGNSAAPVAADYNGNFLSEAEGIDPAYFAQRPTWTTWSKYADFAETVPMVANMALFVGFNSIRIAVMGYQSRRPTDEEIAKMQDLLRDAMEHGALGMSSGLAYVPATYSDTDEVAAVASAMAPYGGIYTSHIRNESKELLQSVEEAIEIGRRAGVAVNISHFKVMGRANWGTHVKAIEAIERARAEGIRVTCDQYPYNCSMTSLAPCMPHWHFDNGTEALVEKLKDPTVREQIRREMEDPATDYENLYLNAGGFDGITVCTTPATPEAEGLTITDYAKKIGKEPFEAYFDLLVTNELIGTAVYHSISDDNIFDIIRLPYVMVGSDGVVMAAKEMCHPRGWGTMVRALSLFTKDNNILPLEETVYRMTGLPAKTYNLRGKGLIQEGYDADLVLLDFDNLKDNATYQNPTALADGIDMVVVDGKVVYQDKALTGEKPGRLLRRK